MSKLSILVPGVFGDFLFARDFAVSKLAFPAALDWATRVGQLGDKLGHKWNCYVALSVHLRP